MNEKQLKIVTIIKKRFSGKMPINLDHDLVTDLILSDFRLSDEEENDLIKIMVNQNIIQIEAN
tara:strand:- start:180 stop:368 length:189 start_codon:yes stop_codon:yes gene_type:complete